MLRSIPTKNKGKWLSSNLVNLVNVSTPIGCIIFCFETWIVHPFFCLFTLTKLSIKLPDRSLYSTFYRYSIKDRLSKEIVFFSEQSVGIWVLIRLWNLWMLNYTWLALPAFTCHWIYFLLLKPKANFQLYILQCTDVRRDEVELQLGKIFKNLIKKILYYSAQVQEQTWLV